MNGYDLVTLGKSLAQSIPYQSSSLGLLKLMDGRMLRCIINREEKMIVTDFNLDFVSLDRHGDGVRLPCSRVPQWYSQYNEALVRQISKQL